MMQRYFGLCLLGTIALLALGAGCANQLGSLEDLVNQLLAAPTSNETGAAGGDSSSQQDDGGSEIEDRQGDDNHHDDGNDGGYDDDDGDDGHSSDPNAGGGGDPNAAGGSVDPNSPAAGDLAAGQALYANQCASCHSLATFDSSGFAGDLSGGSNRLVNNLGALSGAMNGMTLSDQERIDLGAFLDAN